MTTAKTTSAVKKATTKKTATTSTKKVVAETPGQEAPSFEELQVKRELSAQLDRMFTLVNPHGMSVTSVQVYLLKEKQAKTLAYARVAMNECLQLTGLRVVEGANGLFVAYPNDHNYKGEDYRSLFYPVTRELREHIENQVLTKYQEMLDAGAGTAL